jgi:hypothetical protein
MDRLHTRLTIMKSTPEDVWRMGNKAGGISIPLLDRPDPRQSHSIICKKEAGETPHLHVRLFLETRRVSMNLPDIIPTLCRSD